MSEWKTEECSCELSELGARVVDIVKKHDDDSAAGLITNTEQRRRTTEDIIEAMRDLGLLTWIDEKSGIRKDGDDE